VPARAKRRPSSPGKRRRDRYHHGDLARELVDVALRVISEQGGTRELTLREVARRAGVSHTAPYRHFADKKALLAAVAELGYVALRARLLDVRARHPDDARARFIASGVAYVEFGLEHPAQFRVMSQVAKPDSARLQQEAIETFDVVKLTAVDALGPNEDVGRLRRAGVSIWAAMHGLVELTLNRQIFPSVAASAEELARELLAALFDAWSARRVKRPSSEPFAED
jgi:AcrR family transcriptional regulator